MKPLKRARLPSLEPRRIFLGSAILSILAIIATAISGARPIPQPPLWKGKPAFSASNAHEWTRKLAQGYPNRVPWRPERKAASSFLQKELRALGYEPRIMPFDEIIAGKKITGLENIYAILPGTDPEVKDEYVVVLAHYDITDTTIEGAADDASGVGCVLELARLFKKGPAPRRSIVFLLTDSEEFGAFWGAHNFVRQFPGADRIVAALSLDFVAPDEQKDILVLVDGLQKGYAPLWLRETALSAIRAVPYPADDTRHVLEFVQRAILIPPADHGAFLHAGIPAVNLFGRSTDFAHEMGAIHHTHEDNMSHLRVESFDPYGKAAEITLRSIDALPPLRDQEWARDPNYWKISETHYLTGAAASTIHFLFFLPFIVYVGLLVAGLRGRRATALRVMKSEAKGFAMIFSSLLAGYAFIRLLPALDLITRYEMFPATQKSDILNRPAYFALGLVLAVTLALYFILARVFRGRLDRSTFTASELATRHSLNGIILGIVILLAFLKNSYLAALLLLPPAYLWMFMKSNRRFDSRMLNALLFFGGLTSFIAICIAMTMIFHVGVFYWYMFLSLSYGLVTLYAAVLALAVITVGIRILRNQIL